MAALDVSIQADILNLLKQLQRDLDLTFLFISHDLSVVAHVCDYVAVMYLGSLVEIAPTRELFRQPKHPYTKALLSAIPSLDPDDTKQAQRLPGEMPSPANPPAGCRFHTRCPVAQALLPRLDPAIAGRRRRHPCRLSFLEREPGAVAWPVSAISFNFNGLPPCSRVDTSGGYSNEARTA